MKKISWKYIAWGGTGVIIFALIQLLLVSAVSKANKFAVSTIFSSPVLYNSFGSIRRTVLLSSGFTSSGTASCSTFSYFVSGDRDSGIIKISVKQSTQSSPFQMVELLQVAGAERKTACFNR